MMHGWMYGYMWLWWIWPLIVLAGLGLLGYAVVRLARGGWSVPSAERGSSARQILDERFARGEIDEDDYQRRRAQLS